MDYKEYIKQFEYLLEEKNRLMYLILINLIIAVGKETKIEKFKTELRSIYIEVKKTPNPYCFSDGSIKNQKALEKLNDIIKKIIDMLNDNYRSYSIYKKPAD